LVGFLAGDFVVAGLLWPVGAAVTEFLRAGVGLVVAGRRSLRLGDLERVFWLAGVVTSVSLSSAFFFFCVCLTCAMYLSAVAAAAMALVALRFRLRAHSCVWYSALYWRVLRKLPVCIGRWMSCLTLDSYPGGNELRVFDTAVSVC
jgi:hypothetical protein